MEEAAIMNSIYSAVILTTPYPNGQRFDAVALEYGDEIDNASLAVDSFAVAGRQITKTYANRVPEKAAEGRNGKFVILELTSAEQGAEELFMDESKIKKPEPGKPFAPGMYLPPIEIKKLSAKIWQTKPIRAADGRAIPAMATEVCTEQVRETLVDRFESGTRYRLGYNLFKPVGGKEGEKLPLVVFIPDAGMNGAAPRIALLQGGGATLFAADNIQKEHPCYILAFQIPSGIPFTTDEFTCAPEFDDLKKIIDEIVTENPIDERRIYLTGQSQGCMSACELNARYPDFFAASLLVAGQWDPGRMGKVCAGKKLWIFVSDGDEKAYPGMIAVTEELKKNGAAIRQYEMDAKAPVEDQEQAIREAEEDNVNIRFTVFVNHSVLPEGVPDNGGMNHIHTWPAVYRLDELRRWLLTRQG